MTDTRTVDRRSFLFGAACALALAAGAVVMTGAQRGQRPEPEAPPTYFVTSSAGDNAHLWRQPADTERLEYVGQFAAVARGGR